MLDLPLSELAGITQTHARQLKSLNLTTVADLLYYSPRKHLFFKRTRIKDLRVGDNATLVGKIVNYSLTHSRQGNLTLEIWRIRDKTGRITCTRFHNHPRYKSKQWQERQRQAYPPNAIVIITGQVKSDRYTSQGIGIHNPSIEVADLATAKAVRSTLVPIYPLSKGIDNETVQQCTRTALSCIDSLTDPLPPRLKARFGLADWQDAIAHIHFPPNREHFKTARTRLAFDELFYLALSMLQRRRAFQQNQSLPLAKTGILLKRFSRTLPFSLTSAQQRVIEEILEDASQPQPMNRLVQGDVGSGKTCVACFAALAAIQAGVQVALMAPTEILARQHHRKIVRWFAPLGISTALLTGSTASPLRQTIYRDIESGKLSLLVGTHALIQKRVNFKQLGLVICDESHRFGVVARHQLQQKGNCPHVLTMTATPIPRTLALTAYGDLAISRIDELPPGRKPIVTQLLSDSANSNRNRAYTRIREEVRQGRQAYIVLPLVKASTKLNLKAAVAERVRLSVQIFPEFSVGLLHGRMKADEKRLAIAHFQAGKTPILVSTTVVEVGVDNPLATVILIEHAERFGLAQLHQLRGRVGRSQWQSYCYLASDSLSDSSRARLEMMERCQDGFELAEFDLQLRGPGKVLGTQQSGIPKFALADLSEDEALLDAAYRAARRVLKKDPTLERFPVLAEELKRRRQLDDLCDRAVLN